jgi:hypothetical protein
MLLYHLHVYYVQEYATCFDLFAGHHQACSIKTQTKFLELGCPNMDPYYAVGSCYYLANVPFNNVNKCVCKVLMLQDYY